MSDSGRMNQLTFAIAFLGSGVIQGTAQGCRVEVITPDQVFDIIPGESANTAPFSEMQFSANLYGGSAPSVLTPTYAQSPVTYPAPAQGPAVRVTLRDPATGAPGVLPSGVVFSFRAMRASMAGG
jgi:hypothetical protein